MIAALSAAVLVAGLGAIIADRTGRWKLHYILKPGTMAIVMLIAVLRTPAFPPRYQLFIIAGLIASVGGDVFMMLRKKKFTEGLTCFLVAHGLYIAAFLSTMRPRIDPWTILPLFLYAVVMMQILFPHLGKLKAPVGLYIVIITTMAGLGLDRFILMGADITIIYLEGQQTGRIQVGPDFFLRMLFHKTSPKVLQAPARHFLS